MPFTVYPKYNRQFDFLSSGFSLELFRIREIRNDINVPNWLKLNKWLEDDLILVCLFKMIQRLANKQIRYELKIENCE